MKQAGKIKDTGNETFQVGTQVHRSYILSGCQSVVASARGVALCE